MKFEVNYEKKIYTFNTYNPVKIIDIVLFFRDKLNIHTDQNIYIYDDNRFYNECEFINEDVKVLYTALSYPQYLFPQADEIEDKSIEEIIMEATGSDTLLKPYNRKSEKRRVFAVEYMDRTMVFQVEFNMLNFVVGDIVDMGGFMESDYSYY